MKVFLPTFEDDYEWVQCIDSEDRLMTVDFNGAPQAERWQPVRVERFAADDAGREDKPADLPWFTAHALVLRRNAVEALRDMLEPGGEFLPLATDDGVELWLFHATRTIDALDVERSDVWRFADSGRIYFVAAPVFYPERVRGVDFFRLPLHGSEIFVGERFVDRVRAAGLTGMDFELVWSESGGPVKRRLW
jgi:hypothetical protein